jgi:hypothetical protein
MPGGVRVVGLSLCIGASHVHSYRWSRIKQLGVEQRIESLGHRLRNPAERIRNAGSDGRLFKARSSWSSVEDTSNLLALQKDLATIPMYRSRHNLEVQIMFAQLDKLYRFYLWNEIDILKARLGTFIGKAHFPYFISKTTQQTSIKFCIGCLHQNV